MDPDRFLHTAEYLAGLEPLVEEHARTAVGRAYYATALKIRDRVCAIAGVSPQATEMHAFVARWLERNEREGSFGESFVAFKRLRRARNDADYEMRAAPELWKRPNVDSRIADAKSVISVVENALRKQRPEVVKLSAGKALDDVIRNRRP